MQKVPDLFPIISWFPLMQWPKAHNSLQISTPTTLGHLYNDFIIYSDFSMFLNSLTSQFQNSLASKPFKTFSVINLFEYYIFPILYSSFQNSNYTFIRSFLTFNIILSLKKKIFLCYTVGNLSFLLSLKLLFFLQLCLVSFKLSSTFHIKIIMLLF